MEDDTDKSDFTDDEAISGNDNPFSNKQKSHKAVGVSISVPPPHQISPLALYQTPMSNKNASPKSQRKGSNPPLVVNPSTNASNLVRPVVHLTGRNSAPGSRRGSGTSIYGSGNLTGKYYGGLPPEGPTSNPRKGSCTGSYALPVPPEWLRSQKYEANRKRASGNKQYLMDGSFSKSRSGSAEMLPGWLGSVLSGTLVGNSIYTSPTNGPPLVQKEKSEDNKPKISFTQDRIEKDLLPEYQTLKPQYENEIKEALISNRNKRKRGNEEPRASENIKPRASENIKHPSGRGENITNSNNGRSHVKPDATQNTTHSNIKRPHQRKSGNGLSYTNKKTSITDDFEKPQSISSTSTFGFSPPQHPFFEASFYGQRPPPSAMIIRQEPEVDTLTPSTFSKVMRFFHISADPEGPGCCALLLALVSLLLIVATLPFSLCFCIKVVQEYERSVIFRLGRLRKGGAKGPGIFFIIPCIDTYRKVDLRTVSFDVPPQEVLSRDSVTVTVDAVVYYRVSNPTMATNNVEDFSHSTHLLAATTLRNVLGTKHLAEILSERETISHVMEQTLDEATDPWGVKVERVEIKDVRLPVQLQRAMAAEAEAAREARAKVIAAEGEKKASRALRDASDVISESPSALQLRYLQTLNTISAEKNSTIIFPVPMDVISHFLKK